MKKGMTLIELMVVLVIITALIALITAFLRSQIFKGNDARRKAETRRIGIAAEEYEKDNNCYPLPSLVICNPGTGLRPYLDKIPCDPVKDSSYYYEHEDSVCPAWFRIYTNLENTSDTDYIYGIGPGEAFSYVYESPGAPNLEIPESTPPPDGSSGGGLPDTDFYGCFGGVCTLISWDQSRPGPICDPNFQNPTCYGQCVNPNNECVNWN